MTLAEPSHRRPGGARAVTSWAVWDAMTATVPARLSERHQATRSRRRGGPIHGPIREFVSQAFETRKPAWGASAYTRHHDRVRPDHCGDWL